MELKHTQTYDTLSDIEKEIADLHYQVYQKTLQMSYTHPTLEQIKHSLCVIIRNRNEVQQNLNDFKYERHEVTNPKPKVALLQPRPVATQQQPQAQEGPSLSKIPTISQNQDGQPIEPQSEPKETKVVAGAKRGRKKKD